MTQLEKVYLANVLLYINSTEDVIKFIQMNKKCQDVPKMLKLLIMLEKKSLKDKPGYFYNENDCIGDMKDTFNMAFSNNFFKLFPNVETVEIFAYELYALKNINKIKQIRLRNLPKDRTILDNYLNTITEIKCYLTDPITPLNFSMFPNLQKCNITWGYNANIPFEILFPDTNQFLKMIFIQINDDINVLKGLEKYKNFNKIIVHIYGISSFNEEDDIQFINHLKSIATVVTQDISLQNFKNYIFYDEYRSNSITETDCTIELLQQLQKQYYFEQIHVSTCYDYNKEQVTTIDFSKQTQLTSISINSKYSTIQLPNEPNNLVDFSTKGTPFVNDLPTSLTSLSISHVREFKNQLKLPNLLELEISKSNNSFFSTLTTLTSLSCCGIMFTKSISYLTNIYCLELVDCSKEGIQSFYPSSLKHLRLEECKNWDLTGIYNITLISLDLFNKRDTYRFFSLSDSYSNDEDKENNSLQTVPLQFDKLPSLNVLHLDNYDYSGPHSFITQLILINYGYVDSIDLTTYSSLKEIGFKKCCFGFVQLPKCIECVYLHESNASFDMKDLHLKELHFQDCESIDYEAFKSTSITKLSIIPLIQGIDKIFQMFPSVTMSNFI
ncbi:Leucine-rich repeat containing protein [Entamoeba marina]